MDRQQEEKLEILSEERIKQELESLKGWTLEGKSIKKTFTTKDYPQTMGLVTAIGSFCQRHDHHPDYLLMKYTTVEVSFSTHIKGGITIKDIKIAKDLNTLEEAFIK